MLRIREVVDSHRETTLHVEGGTVRALDRVAIVHALDFIDALLKGDGTS